MLLFTLSRGLLATIRMLQLLTWLLLLETLRSLLGEMWQPPVLLLDSLPLLSPVAQVQFVFLRRCPLEMEMRPLVPGESLVARTILL